MLAVRHAYRGTASAASAPLLTMVGLAVWLAVTALLAELGVLASLANSPKLGLYIVASNGLALALALSPLGLRIISRVPIALVVGAQGFRLPLELVLHSWYEQGVLPIQMTYAGDNFDIVTGILSLVVGAFILFGDQKATVRRWLVLGCNLVGFSLLLTVASIAVRSTPWPLRTYTNDPPVLLVFHAPYTWIVPICVAGALFGHVLVFRWLVREFRS
ncbi:MAG: hypothetical protein RJA70_2059 [Pseudomonadota bacterium]